jgi:hypothetical protein
MRAFALSDRRAILIARRRRRFAGSAAPAGDIATIKFVGKVNLSIKDDGNAGTLVIDPAVASTAQNAAFDPLRFASSRHRTLGFAENDAGSSAPRTVADGGHAASIALLGKHMAASFVAAPFGHSGTLATDAQARPTPLLSRPHL